jgi:hypothetical protein
MFRALEEFVHKIGILHGIAVVVLLIASTTVLVNRGGSIVTLIAGSAASLGESTIVYITPHSTSSLEVGETERIDVRVHTKTPINTIGATITYPPDQIEVVGISKETSFLNLWTEDTAIKEDTGEVHFSGGTTDRGGLSGIGTIVTLTVRAKKAGSAIIGIKDAEIFAADGKGTAVASSKRAYTFEIPEKLEVATNSSTQRAEESLPPLSIDFNGDGKVNVVDLSIIAIQLVTPYNAKYDLDRSGENTLADLSIFFARMRQP